MSLPASALASNQHAASDIRRPCVDYAPSIWGDVFLPFASQSMEVNNNEKQQAEILKEEVKKMFQSAINQNTTQKLNFIDSIQRLGVSYQFQGEINETLEQIHNNLTKNNSFKDDLDHHSLALLFRLLRQQGYQISSDVFNKFKSEQGNFNEKLANDIQGMCSMHEATHLRTRGDDILEEAHDFTYTHLNSLAKELIPSLATKINYCLRKPFNKSVSRSEARYQMTLYEQDPFRNETLLTFAKLDYNNLQKLHQKEIGTITKWWKQSDFVTKVPYARDRLVESYVWPLAMSCEPKYSNGRMFLGKMVGVVCLLDDTYDAYGTVQELELFTEAIQRWDTSPIGSLPQSMKVVFDTVIELGKEIELVTAKSGKSSLVVPHFKEAVYKLIEGYMVEARWCHEGYVPTYDEYKVNGVFSSTFPLFLTTFIGLGEYATEDVFHWISSNPIIIKAVSVIGRVLDDMASHKFEQQREHVASAVECCMKQYSISQEEAYTLIHKDVEDYWRLINEEYLKINYIPKSVLDCVVNLARMSEFSYENHLDRYTNGELNKEYVSSLLVDPIHI